MAEPFYFQAFEDRRPYEPAPRSVRGERLWHWLGSLNLILGLIYLGWRWTAGMNHDALWWSIPMALAETAAYIGLMLYTFNLWRTEDTPRQPAPALFTECGDATAPERPLTVDVFIATYTEDPELVRLSIADAKRLTYPHPIEIVIHILDDGRRDAMRAVAEQEGVRYITRASNIGYKAGNLRNALEQTSGDFIVICDADTRLFPQFLTDTLGYFRNGDVAWVQTPQWFYDIPEGDPFGVDPRFFYDVIQRRRNRAGASFCCGAGSVHRRDAVMTAAVRAYADQVCLTAAAQAPDASHPLTHDVHDDAVRAARASTALTPFKFHVLEDLYTSIAIHSDPTRRWISVFHPWPLARMLSPQDLQSWMIQRFKYAAGTIDILVHDNPLFRRGLPLAARLMYAATFWANLSGLWTSLLVAAPILYLFTGVAPVRAYHLEFFMFIAPFVLTTELALRAASRGVPSWSGRLAYIAAFPLFLQALWTVLRGRRIAFPVTPKTRAHGRFLHLVIPQIAVLALSVAAVLTGVWRVQHGTLTTTGLLVNGFWCALNGLAMWKLVSAAWWQPRVAAAAAPRRLTIGASAVAAIIVAATVLAAPAATNLRAAAAGPGPQVRAPLTDREAGMARAAWSYFEANYQPTTCLANSVEGYPSTTLWDTASYMGALVAADRLKLIPEHEASARLSCLLKTLASLDLVDGALPNKAYDTRSARMTNYQNQPGEIGTSAVDAGRLLIWLRIVKDRYPEQADAVDKVALHWRYCAVLDAYGTLYGSYRQPNGTLTRVQEGRLGYEEYAAKGFQLWGFDTTRASQVDPFRRRTVDGIPIEYDARDPKSFGAHTAVVSEPSLLDGLELNWDTAADRHSADAMHTDGWAADYAERIYAVQERRFRATGRLTARTEHHLNVAPYFVYDAILANDVPWNTVTEDSLAVPQFAAVSSRAAIAMWALWRTDYTTQLFEAQAPLADQTRGFFEGVFEAGAVIPVRTANTNGVILAALLHKVDGKLLRPAAPRDGLWERALADPAACGSQCLPRAKSGVAR